MRLVYFSHSYRKEDADLVRYFGELIRSEGMHPVLDPPSKTVSAARLQRHLRDSDGMVAILTRRDDGVSPHILFEAALCLQARKPLIVFIEDVLELNLIPSRVLTSRFSRKWFFRQLRDHRQAVRVLRSYLGDAPPPRYQPTSTRRTCFPIGLGTLETHVRDGIIDAIGKNGYDVVADPMSDQQRDGSVRLSEYLACADLVLQVVDSPDAMDHYLRGAVRSAFIPCISLTQRSDYPYDQRIPREYQPCIISPKDKSNVCSVLVEQFDLYEQGAVELDTIQEVTRYVELLLSTASSAGVYDQNIRNLFIEELTMGDQYKVGQAGAVGPNSHAHDMTFQQIWNDASTNINLHQLAAELAQLRSALKEKAQSAEEDAAVGEVALAEVAASRQDGVKALTHLKNGGRWTLDIAEKIGVAVAAGAIKTALGL